MKLKHIKAYMESAEAFAKCSSAQRLKVGSVIVKNNRIISCGYNAMPEHIDGPLEEKVYLNVDAAGWLDIESIDKEYPLKDEIGNYKLVTKPEVRHSEKSALMGLIKSSESAVGSTLFCTHACCKYCSIDIVDAGVTKVIYKEDYRLNEGIEYLKENGVEVIKYSDLIEKDNI